LNTRLVVTLSVVVVVLLAGTFLLVTQPGGTSTTTDTKSQSSTTVTTVGTSTSTGYANATRNLDLQLSVNASSAPGSGGNATVTIRVDEYNTLAAANNVSAATEWGLNDTSLGSCGDGVLPFGIAVFSGIYTSANVSQATPLRIYPVVPCPMFIRLVTGYDFQPASDLAVVLPSGSNATAMQMLATVNVTGIYGSGAMPSSTAIALGPGTYTVAATDEWGSVVVVNFTVGTSSN
jgi:hypothetical protein